MITINDTKNIFGNDNFQNKKWLYSYFFSPKPKGFIIEDLTDVEFIENNIDLLKNNINSTNLNLGIGTYYNLIGNIENIINVERIINIINSLNIQQITIQIPFLKESLVSTIKDNQVLTSNSEKLFNYLRNNNISIEFVLNNFLDIYLVKKIIQKFNLYSIIDIRISIGPQFLFINYDPLNLKPKTKEEIELFFINSKKILTEFQETFGINIYQTYFYLGHIAYFYGIDYLTNKNILNFIQLWENKIGFKGNLLFNKTIFSITDRLYSYFIQRIQNKNYNEVGTRISNKEIYQWLINNINNIQHIGGSYNYNVFKGLDDGKLSKITSYYKDIYEYYIIDYC